MAFQNEQVYPIEYKGTKANLHIGEMCYVEIMGIRVASIIPEWGKCLDCGEDGTIRIENGIPAGIHCQICWEKLVTECRRRSW